MQARLNWLVAVSAAVDSLPDVALAPDQLPEAVQDVAFVEDQVIIEDPPLVTVVGFAESDTVGDGGDTVTVADALCAPPDPVQVRLKVLLLVSAPEDSLPEVALAPDQPAEALHDVAFVEDQVSVEDPPLVTDVGFAAIDTVGTGGGGGEPVTVTVVDVLAVPPDPVQERLNVVVLVKAGVDEPPETTLLPDQPPEAVQDDASVEDQLSVEVAPLATDVGFAVSDTVGTGDWAAAAPASLVWTGAGQPASAKTSMGMSTSPFRCNMNIFTR